MSSLKERFENHSTQPDPEVWNRIENTLHHRAVVRRTVVTSSVAAVALTVAGIFLLRGHNNEPVQVAQTDVPQNVVAQPAATVEENTVVATEQTMPVETTRVMPSESRRESSSETKTREQQQAQSQPASTTPAQPVAVQSAAPVVQPVTVAPVATVTPQSTATERPTVSATTEDRPSAPAPKLAQRDEDKSGSTDLIVWIPNAFSPDDEVAENKVFKVKPNSEATIRSFEIYIYNRHGRQVFHSKDINQGWDGRFNGQAQPMGAYVYVLQINDADKGLMTKKGTVTLIR